MTVRDKLLIYLILIAFTTGCTTMQPLPSTDYATVSSQVSAGDIVEIERLDGEILRFEIAEIAETGIAGEGKFVAFTEIREIRTPSEGISTGQSVVIGVVLGLGVAALVGSALESMALGIPPQ